jgi:spore germination cell wall hydrolase CwlJ-like protein
MNAGEPLKIGGIAASRRWLLPALFSVLALAMLAAGLLANVNRRDDLSRARTAAATATLPGATPLAPLNLVKPLTPDEAIKQNQERPFDAPPDTAASRFQIRTDQGSRDRAAECLTQVVYYEAASESPDGQRAVAQVVLNRMRHPGFPSSVCGVVYQGSGLPTGCQFTFTCDGSLARTPVPALWARARKIALDALGGHVFAPVGHSTHYHADYVLPYWADSLAKQVQIGHHIFYRLRAGLGSAAAFSQHYAGNEPNLPSAPSTVAVTAEAADQAQALLNSGLAGDKPPPLVADAAGVAASGEPKQVLLADSSKGGLLIDQSAAQAIAVPKKRRSEDCQADHGRQMLPSAPNNLRVGSSAGAC